MRGLPVSRKCCLARMHALRRGRRFCATTPRNGLRSCHSSSSRILSATINGPVKVRSRRLLRSRARAAVAEILGSPRARKGTAN
eukprot:48046-Pyramimonas_sp.AAC.1